MRPSRCTAAWRALTHHGGDCVGDLLSVGALQEGEQVANTPRERFVVGVHPGVNRAVIQAALEALMLATVTRIWKWSYEAAPRGCRRTRLARAKTVGSTPERVAHSILSLRCCATKIHCT